MSRTGGCSVKMDFGLSARHIPRMRACVLIALLCLSACGTKPADWGIVGPGASPAPKSREEAIPTGDISMPYAAPNTGSGRYWGYN